MPRRFRKISSLGRKDDAPLALKPGDRVFITSKAHVWHGNAGEVLALESYGLGWTGWRTHLDNGFDTYVKPEEVRKA